MSCGYVSSERTSSPTEQAASLDSESARRTDRPRAEQRSERHSPTSFCDPRYHHHPQMWAHLMIAMTLVTAALSRPYDPDDPNLESVLPSKDVAFEAFYPREAYGVENGSARPSHGHASFYSHRNPALVDAKNSPAYGFRFDGKRRFNFDEDE